VSPELEAALLACLEKTRAKRPQTARDLANLLDRAPTAGSWTQSDAEAWWGRHERAKATGSAAGTATDAPPPPGSSAPAPVPTANRTSSSGFDQTIASGDGTT
jgi:hypothetical protein